MRINVYHEELTTEMEFVKKHVEKTGNTYFGLRIFLKSPPDLHHTSDDDDRTAITFWFGTKHLAYTFFNMYTDRIRTEL